MMDRAQEREESEPNRVFLGWDAPILPRVAAWLLDAHPTDLGEQVVVVPGRRSGRLLLSHLVALVERGGVPASGSPIVGRGSGGFVPPRVVTPGALPELFYGPPSPIANRRSRLLAWCAVLEAAPVGSWPGAGPAAEVSARFALARDLVRSQDELGEEGLRLADVPERAAAALGAGADADRWRVLGSLEHKELDLLTRQ